MLRLRSLGSALLMTGALALLVFYGNKSLGATAVIAVVSLSAASAFQTTFQNWIGAGQISSEGFATTGTILVVMGPDGPFTGMVERHEPRITVLVSQDGHERCRVPNVNLTGPVKILDAWPAPVPLPIPA